MYFIKNVIITFKLMKLINLYLTNSLFSDKI